FGSCLKGKKVVCLGIPDDYGYMDSELIRLLEAKAGPFFAR
ncbi:MAG: phosphotyrosine protein phosphatase, partial [Elusimicrobia bacterium]|nr:phosphotyrosine protein phosphatase [Elusimicrobiota bacterium]